MTKVDDIAERVTTLSQALGAKLEALRVQVEKTDRDVMQLDANIAVLANAIADLPKQIAQLVGKNGTTTVPHLQALNGTKVVSLRGGRKGRKRQ